MKKLIIVIALLVLCKPQTTHAAAKLPISSLKVSPVVIPLQIKPSQNISLPIKLTNISNAPLPLRASFNDFQTTGEEGDYNFADSRANPLLQWSSISPEEVIIPAHEEKEVTLTIKTPPTVPVGGYFGMLFFEPVLEPQIHREATQIVPRIGLLLLGSVGVENKPQTEILTFDLPLTTDKTHLVTLLRVKNIGLQYVTAKPLITTASLYGDMTKQVWEDKVVFPGKIRRWTETLGFNHPLDVVTVRLTVSNGNGSTTTVTKTVIVLPYLQAILFIGIVVIAFLVILKRKNLRQALSILFFDNK